MEVDNIFINVSDDISVITSGSGETSSALSTTDELKSHGLHLSNADPVIISDSEGNFVACSQSIPSDEFAPDNLHGYIARYSRARHYCCLCHAEIGSGI